MIEFIVSSVFVSALGVAVYHTKRKSDKAFKIMEESWNTNLLAFVEKNGLTGIDIQFKTPSDIKKKSDAKESIKFIAAHIPKGYDIIDASFEKGYKFGPHDHEYSNEFVYVLSGKIKIVECVNTPNNCKHCVGECSLWKGHTDSGEDLLISILTPRSYKFMIAGRFHTFEALEDSRCIVITVPPIARGAII